MSVDDIERLYALLPAWVRLRDQTEGGGTLKALLGVIASQAGVVAADLDQLYDDQFIETCAPWVIPYIGDLIGFRPLRPIGLGQPSATRAEVAHTIGARRRKGTLSVLEQLTADVTGWPAIAVEYFQRLATTQYVRNHLRAQNAIVDLRSPITAADIGSAFDRAPRTGDVRRVTSGRGRHNIPNVGVFVWRLKAYTNTRATARRLAPNQYTFDPFGRDVPLANPPQPTAREFALVVGRNVPFPLVRYPLYAELEARRKLGPGSPLPYFAPPPFQVRDTTGSVIDPAAIQICDLTTWAAPTAPGIRAAVDPELGRLTFAAPAPADTDAIRVDFTTVFSGDYGGGAYVPSVPRDQAVLESQPPPTHLASTADLSVFDAGVVEIVDSGIHAGDVTLSPTDGLLVVRAAGGQRPVLAGKLTINAVTGASITLRGLGITGPLTIHGSGPFTLRMEHCTLRSGLDWSATIEGTLDIDHCLCAAVTAHPEVTVTFRDSVVDGGSDGGPAVSGGGGAAAGSLTISRSTIFGTIEAREIPLLENSIVTGLVTCARRQDGCVRYSYLPRSQGAKTAETPRRFRCQPDLAIDGAAELAVATNSGLSSAELAALVRPVEARLVPAFTSRNPSQPGYAQLAEAAPDEIRYGAEDGDEMGVFFGLYGPRKEANLRFRLSEFLRIGLEFGVIHAS